MGGGPEIGLRETSNVRPLDVETDALRVEGRDAAIVVDRETTVKALLAPVAGGDEEVALEAVEEAIVEGQ